MGHARLPTLLNGPRLVNPVRWGPLAESRFCTGSAQGPPPIGLEEDRSTNLRSRATEATWWATALPESIVPAKDFASRGLGLDPARKLLWPLPVKRFSGVEGWLHRDQCDV